jgi:hypothetical protein
MSYKDKFIWATTGAGVYGVTIGAPAMFGDGLSGIAAFTIGAVATVATGDALTETDLFKNYNCAAYFGGSFAAFALVNVLGVGEAADEPKTSLIEPAHIIETVSVAEQKEPIAMIGDQPFFALD